jgi:hypothetical protein
VKKMFGLPGEVISMILMISFRIGLALKGRLLGVKLTRCGL